MILFLALLARAGHGKSTAAKHLTRTYDAKTIALATPLKRTAQKVMGFSDAQMWGTQADKEAIDPRYGFSARKFLQLLGTEGMRQEFGQNIHLDAMVNSVMDSFPVGVVPNGLYIVDDARFLNEVMYLNRVKHKSPYLNGATIKILCTDAPVMEGPEAQHSSEQEIDRVPNEELAATVVSSRAQGVLHLVEELEKAIATAPKLAPFRSMF